jgi:folate-binding protein YgfZ
MNAGHHITDASPFVRHETHSGALFVSGKDALDLLNRLSTQKVDDLLHGQVKETLFTNEKGRVIDAALAFRTREGVLLLTSPGRSDALRAWLEKFTIMEDCAYDDRSGDYAQLLLYGDIPHLPGFEPHDDGHSAEVTLGGAPCIALRFRSVTGSSMRLLVPPDSSAAVMASLAESYAVIDDDAFHLWRVIRRMPAVGYEIGEHANPLESGGGAAVNFTKGCYIGQEVIARLDSYDKVQRQIAGLHFHADASPLSHGDVLMAGTRDAGFVTTVRRNPTTGEWVGLGLLRKAFLTPGLELTCGGLTVTVLE